MNTLKTVFSKLFKEETKLASHEIELALGEDLRKAENDLKTALLNASNIERSFEEAKKTLKSENFARKRKIFNQKHFPLLGRKLN